MQRNNYSRILWLFGIISPFALIPFERAVSRFLGIDPLVFTPWHLALAAIEAAVIYGLMIKYGMQWATARGARFLLLEKNVNFWRDLFKPGLVAGIVCALAILVVDQCLPASPLNFLVLAKSIPPLIGFFGLFFCIVNQEIFLNLFCVAGIATGFKYMCKELPNDALWILSILITSVIFGIVHLPVFVYQGMPDMALVILRSIVLNLLSGITFGMLFWKKSFETAIWGHVVVDAIVFVIVPLYALYLQ